MAKTNIELFGRKINAGDNEQPIRLSEVALAAAPENLRRLARFLNHCAAELEANRLHDHAHFTDFEQGNEKSNVEVVVVNPVIYGGS
jgi:hypothetical protein